MVYKYIHGHEKSVLCGGVKNIKVYELMSRLEKLPSGVEVMCSGVKTLDSITDNPDISEDRYGNKEYLISESIVDVDLEGNRVYLQF